MKARFSSPIQYQNQASSQALAIHANYPIPFYGDLQYAASADYQVAVNNGAAWSYEGGESIGNGKVSRVWFAIFIKAYLGTCLNDGDAYMIGLERASKPTSKI